MRNCRSSTGNDSEGKIHSSGTDWNNCGTRNTFRATSKRQEWCLLCFDKTTEGEHLKLEHTLQNLIIIDECSDQHIGQEGHLGVHQITKIFGNHQETNGKSFINYV